MKKILIVLLTFTLALAFTACGGGSDDSSDTSSSGSKAGNEWPEDDYIPEGIEYDEGGEIVVVADTESEGIKGVNVFIKGATLDDMKAYVNKLIDKGIISDSNEPEDIGGGGYVWAGTYGDSFYIDMDFADEIRTTVDVVDDEMVNLEYNFHIATGNNPYN